MPYVTTHAEIEKFCELAQDALDRAYLSSSMTEAEYNRHCADITRWEMERKAELKLENLRRSLT